MKIDRERIIAWTIAIVLVTLVVVVFLSFGESLDITPSP